MYKLFLLFVLFIVGCHSLPSNPEKWMEKKFGACVPTAIVFRQSLQKYNIWSEVFRYTWIDSKNRVKGHAMVAYLYPPGQNKLWTYDGSGSYLTRAYVDDVLSLAQSAHKIRGFKDRVIWAEYIK